MLSSSMASATAPVGGPTASNDHHCKFVPEPWCETEVDLARIIGDLNHRCRGDPPHTAVCHADYVLGTLAPIVGASLCGREIMRTVIATHQLLGRCTSSTTWAPPILAVVVNAIAEDVDALVEDLPERVDEISRDAREAAGEAARPVWAAVDQVLATVYPIIWMIDTDGDGIPDAIEPTLCFVEDENQSVDGSCTGQDYHPR